MFYVSFSEPHEYLAHHGIKGQRWGVRRFQNSDGSYTTEGKQRRNVGRTPAEKKAAAVRDLKNSTEDYINKIKSDHKKYRDLDKKLFSGGMLSDTYKQYARYTNSNKLKQAMFKRKNSELANQFEQYRKLENEYTKTSGGNNEQYKRLIDQSDKFIQQHGHKAFQKALGDDANIYYTEMWRKQRDDKVDYKWKGLGYLDLSEYA